MMRIQVTGEILGKELNFGIDVDGSRATKDRVIDSYVEPALRQILYEFEHKLLEAA